MLFRGLPQFLQTNAETIAIKQKSFCSKIFPFYHLSVHYRQSPEPELNPRLMKDDLEVLANLARTWLQIRLIQWHIGLETYSCAAGQNDLHTVTSVWIPYALHSVQPNPEPTESTPHPHI